MSISFLLDRFEEARDADAIVWQDMPYTYSYILKEIENWRSEMMAQEIDVGSVVVLEADFSPLAVAIFLVLVEHGCIVVPLTPDAINTDAFIEIAQAEYHIRVQPDGGTRVVKLSGSRSHDLYRQLNASKHPGLVLFSSGSTGPSKAALHDMGTLLAKYRRKRKALRSIAFLLFDHIGGVNTMLYLLRIAAAW